MSIPGVLMPLAALSNNLRVTEMMYYAAPGSDYDYIEFHNTSTSFPLILDGVTVSKGIDYTFPPGTALGQGEYLVAAKLPGSSRELAGQRHHQRVTRNGRSRSARGHRDQRILSSLITQPWQSGLSRGSRCFLAGPYGEIKECAKRKAEQMEYRLDVLVR